MKANSPSRPALGQLSDIDLRLLRVFRVVADCGGMAAAELELNIGSSTISRHIKDLETRLGLRLCRRGRAGFALTPEGQKIYAQTTQLLAATDAFRSSVDEIHQRMGGQLQVAVFDKTASNPQAHVAQAIARFTDRAADVALHLHVATLNGIERGVLDGQFHLGIIPGHRTSDTLHYEHLFDERMHLYCGASHPLFADAPAGVLDDERRAGGIYMFETKAAAEAYVNGPIVARMKANADIGELEIRVFDVRQRMSEITNAPLPNLRMAAE
jgi:DNA-binding transcriptional LysR family regulator